MEINVINKISIPLIITLFLLSGCQRNSEKQSPQQIGTEQQAEEIPEQLEAIEESIEKIIKYLNGPAVKTEEDESDSDSDSDMQSDQQQDDKQSQEDGKQAEKNEPENEQQNEQKSQTDNKPQEKEIWGKIAPVINDLHYKWNDYMPSAVKMGANNKLVDNFSKALNSLTSTVIGKNSTNTLMAANFLYAYIPDFYLLYKTQSSPEIKRIRYFTRNVMLNSMTANWEQADYDIGSLKSSWALYKNTIPKDKQEDSNRLDLSIYELEKVVKERNQPLIDIKGRVAISNIQTIEESLEQGGSQQIEQQSE